VATYRGLVRFVALLTIALGVLMLVLTLRRGGGGFSVGVVLGLLFVAAGAGRLYLTRRRQ
jgi:multisubunit Na+/H+ antiporter MnhB subunit